MKWAVEIRKSSLGERNLSDLLGGLGFELVDGIDYKAVYASFFDEIKTAGEVYSEAKKLRDAFLGPAAIDSEFQLGSVIDFSASKPKRHAFIEVQSIVSVSSVGDVTLTVSPSSDLTEEELKIWEEERVEKEYQHKLEKQRENLEPAYREPRASSVLTLLGKEPKTGETLYKLYETMEGHPSNRSAFHLQFGISKHEFKRFGDAVHNPSVSGEFARHAYEDKPKTENPMSIQEAEVFIRELAKKWLKNVREKSL